MLVIKFKDIIKYLACIILIISVFILIARYFFNLNKDKKFINKTALTECLGSVIPEVSETDEREEKEETKTSGITKILEMELGYIKLKKEDNTQAETPTSNKKLEEAQNFIFGTWAQEYFFSEDAVTNAATFSANEDLYAQLCENLTVCTKLPVQYLDSIPSVNTAEPVTEETTTQKVEETIKSEPPESSSGSSKGKKKVVDETLFNNLEKISPELPRLHFPLYLFFENSMVHPWEIMMSIERYIIHIFFLLFLE